MEYLGESFDIHTGGIDHIPVHHENEIAQSEGATGKQFVKYWVHHDFVNIDKEKMSKSKKNFLRVEEIEGKGYDPMALRYLYLTAHYRSEMAFSFESLTSAQVALNKLREEVRGWEVGIFSQSSKDKFYDRFLEAVNEDLNVPKALAVVWEMVKSNMPSAQKAADLLEMDKILGLELSKVIGQKIEIPEEVQKLVDLREKARLEKDFERSDELRGEIKRLGYEVLDSADGAKVKKV